MNLRQAHRLVKLLRWLNVAITLGLIALVSRWTLTWLRPSMPVPTVTIQVPPPPQRVGPEKYTEYALVPCSALQILEEAPVKPVVLPKPVMLPPKPVVVPLTAPYRWVGVMVHPQPAKSYAILLDERTQQQTLVWVGEIVAGSGYAVTEISATAIKLRQGDGVAVVARPPLELKSGDKGRK